MFSNSSTSVSRPLVVTVYWNCWSVGAGGAPICPADETALRPVILREQLLEQVREREPAVYSLDETKYVNAVRAAYRHAFDVDGVEPPPHAEMEAALLARTEVPPARLAALAQARIDAVIAVLVDENGVPRERVTGRVDAENSSERPEVAFELR